MIVKMTRYDFLLYHRDVPQFLERLRELGLVDITLRDFSPTAEQQATMDTASEYLKIHRALKGVKSSGNVLPAVEQMADDIKRSVMEVLHKANEQTPFSTVEEAVREYKTAKNAIDSIEARLVSLRSEINSVKPWGEFSTKDIEELAKEGVVLRFYSVPTKNFKEEWSYDYALEVIDRGVHFVHFCVAARGEEITQTLPMLGAIEVPAPRANATQIEHQIEELIKEQATLQNVVARAALSAEEIKERAVEMQQDIDFVKVENSADDMAEGTLKVLEGWSETSKVEEIETFVQSQEVYYTKEDAKVEQNPPIKLKNSFFARLYEPVGALYINPRYDELDLTPFFAPFFMIFFGMCFGDAGYGILLILAVVALWRKIPKQYKDIGWLVIFLNLAAVVFGIFSGNVFGIELVEVEALKEFKEFFLSPDDIFNLSILIGGVQVSFGLILRTFNRIKRGGSFVYGVSNIGWLILIFSSIVAFTPLFPGTFDTSSLAYEITMWGAVALILLFSSPGNVFMSIGKGLYSFYEMATGLIGDLISYVRLFAIGLAGAIIAQVFNELSVGLSGDIPVVSFLVMLIILIIGHGLNIFISILGAMVHPIRLTFVEFYKNAEFEGGGRKFNPFKLRIKK